MLPGCPRALLFFSLAICVSWDVPHENVLFFYKIFSFENRYKKVVSERSGKYRSDMAGWSTLYQNCILLVVLAPCGFFLGLAVCLGMLLTNIHHLLKKTCCLRTDIKSHTEGLQVQTWEGGQHPLPEGPCWLHVLYKCTVVVPMFYLNLFKF